MLRRVREENKNLTFFGLTHGRRRWSTGGGGEPPSTTLVPVQLLILPHLTPGRVRYWNRRMTRLAQAWRSTTRLSLHYNAQCYIRICYPYEKKNGVSIHNRSQVFVKANMCIFHSPPSCVRIAVSLSGPYAHYPKVEDHNSRNNNKNR